MPNGHTNTGSTAGASLPELAEKLSDLRKDLDEVIARVKDLHREDRMSREEAHAPTPDRLFGMPNTDRGCLRCHECGRLSSTDRAGWTLRLCGDDELHPFCPACDGRHVTGNRNGNGEVADSALQI